MHRGRRRQRRDRHRARDTGRMEPGRTARSWTTIDIPRRLLSASRRWQERPAGHMFWPNLQGVGGMASTSSTPSRRRWMTHGHRRAKCVEFAGHSQGGIMAAQLATNPNARSRYNVVSVVTAGSPLGHHPSRRRTRLLLRTPATSSPASTATPGGITSPPSCSATTAVRRLRPRPLLTLCLRLRRRGQVP